MYFNKKALSPIIAVMLLLMVSVVSGSVMFKWYNQYTSDLLTQGETKTNSKLGITKIQDLIGSDLYFRNGYSGNITVTDIKIGNKSCGISTTLTPGMRAINLSECSQNLSEYRNEVVIYTNEGIFTKYLYFSSGIPSESNPVVESLTASFQWYNYTINNSLRFDGTTSYLSRTPSVVGNRTTWTWSGWVKRSKLGVSQDLFASYLADSLRYFALMFDTDNRLVLMDNDGTLNVMGITLVTTQLFRDTSSWDHIVVKYDTTQAIDTNRVKIYINGVEINNFEASWMGTYAKKYPIQNFQGHVNKVQVHDINSYNNGLGNYFNGYLSEVNFIDGQALNASYFGEFNDAGKWTPKQYNGTYGTNGFYLPFNNTNILGEDNSPIENTVTEDFSQGGIKIESDRWNGDTLFLDTSGNKHPITAYGNTIHSTTTKMFGDTSIYFDGTGDYLTIPDSEDWNLSTENFTIDGWVNIGTNSKLYPGILGQYVDGNNRFYLRHEKQASWNNFDFQVVTGGVNIVNLHGTSIPSDNTWYHVAVTRYGNNWSLYVNGNREATTISATTFPNLATTLWIGKDPVGSGNSEWTGYMDKIRITKGKALWTSNFVTEKAPNDWTANNLDETGGLLIHSNVTSNYTSIQFKDESGQGHSITRNGDTVHSLKTSANDDNSAIYFDGTTDFLEIPIHSDLYFTSSENYTIDFWAKHISGEGGFSLGNYQDSVCNGLLHLQFNSGEINLNPNGPTCGYTYNIINGADATGEWTHYAYVKSGTNYSFYINGNIQGSFIFSGTLNTPDLVWFGKRTTGGGVAQYWNGYLDEVRISKEARWTSEFTPDTTPYTTDANTKLLIHSNYNEILDSGDHKHKITPVGDAKHSTSTSKFGTSSLYFDGTGDYLTISDSEDWNFGTQPFTIDLWVYPLTTGIDRHIISQSPDANNAIDFFYNSVGNVYFLIKESATMKGYFRTNSLSMNFNQWNHIVVTKYGTGQNEFDFFVNGIKETDIFWYNNFAANTAMPNFATNLKIGRSDYYGATYDMLGYLDEVRITKGKALWTTNFTPDTSPANKIESYSTDVMIDTPTNNFATLLGSLQPLSTGGGNVKPTFADGNLYTKGNAADSWLTSVSTIGVTSGKWYFEGYLKTVDSLAIIGITDARNHGQTYLSQLSIPMASVLSNGAKDFAASDVAPTRTNNWAGTYTSGDLIRVAIDLDSNPTTVKFAKGEGNTWANGAGSWNQDYTNGANAGSLPTNPNGGSYLLSVDPYGGNTEWIVNFGQGGLNGVQWCENASGYFKYCPPSGFKALSTANLPSPTINISKAFFDILNWTGDGTSQNVTGLSFSPDLVWVKNRDTTAWHHIVDNLRGVPDKTIHSNSNIAEHNPGNGQIINFSNDGFTYSSGIDFNGKLIAWNWKESQLAGIDIVTFTTDNTETTAFAHNLNKTPDLIIVKDRNNAYNWNIWHKKLVSPSSSYLQFNTNAAGSLANLWGASGPNNESFYFKALASPHIAYIFTEKEGFSKFGKYTNNNAADGPFIYTGFKPKYVMIKTFSAGTSSWYIYDTARDSSNPISGYLLADTTGIEATTGHDIDILSNGFKLRTALDPNYLTYETIYIAFAEYPFR